MLKVAIVGCGKIADSHASQIQRIRNSEIVAVCDREELMAKQLFDRYPVKHFFSNLDELFDKARPDVVHITTPPQSHYDIGKQCLERGCHIYIEKPFTLVAREAEDLIDLAKAKNLKVTAGHDDQFRHAARRMRDLVREGYLGGPPVHLESYYCYEFAGTGYAKALLADKEHWVRKLPGKLLHNIISHGIARIAEFVGDEMPLVIADGFVSPLLEELGEKEIIDELRVIVRCKDGMTSYFTFSSQMRPSLHQLRLYGAQNGLILDQDNETLIKLPGKRLTSYLEQFVAPLKFARQYTRGAFGNMRRFLVNDFHPKAGMKYLIESFYNSIVQDDAPPIPYSEIMMTARIMDEIFSQLNQKNHRVSSQSVAGLSFASG